MTRTIITSMFTLHGLVIEPASPAAKGPAWEPVGSGAESGTGAWSAFAQGELVQSGDFRMLITVSGDGVRLDASWRF